MRIFIICSKAFYKNVESIKSDLVSLGHEIVLPNCYDDPGTESRIKLEGRDFHSKFKSEMIRHSEEVIRDVDAVLVLNFEKNGIKGYIGGATFLEIYDAFRLNKIIYFYNEIVESNLSDELNGFNPIILHGDLNLIK